MKKDRSVISNVQANYWEEDITLRELILWILLIIAGVILLMIFCLVIVWPINVWFQETFPDLVLKGWHPC